MLRGDLPELLVRLMARARKKNPTRQMPAALKRYWQARNKRLRNPAKKQRKRRRNPVQTQHVLLAQVSGGPVLKYLGGVKFSRTGHAVRFATKAAGQAAARTMRQHFPVLKSYRLWVT
jgi:hypothetical protein